MKKVLRTLFALAILVGLVYLVSPQELLVALEDLSMRDIGRLALLSIALIYVSALKWKLFIEFLKAPVSLVRLFGLYLVGYFVNLLMPSYVGGDIVRSWYIGKKVGQHEALAATILERYTGLLAMVLLALCFMWFVDNVTVEIRIAIALVGVGLGIITVLALADRPAHLLERFAILRPVLVGMHKVQSGFRLARGNVRLLGTTLILSFLYHSLTVVNTVVAAQAVGWEHPPVWDLFVVLPIILLVGSIPATPNGLGIQEGAFYFFLHGIGATPAQALGVAVVLRAKSYVLAVLGGLVWLRMKGENPK